MPWIGWYFQGIDYRVVWFHAIADHLPDTGEVASMPIALSSYAYYFAVSILGLHFAILGALITSDSLAAAIGALTIVSAGLATIVKNWREMLRQQKMRDVRERIDALEDFNRELQRLLRLQRDQYDEARKTFEAIRDRMAAEIAGLRATIAEANSRMSDREAHE